ncbi:MAG: efflux RND transporter permease subunit [Candidatus Abyssobacteria bacterium SURF_5]|uniref:Efflux RND transporter permease subunit n=1 Tax=Abyssobacteria bacterium (strain SURF_5) TaxID=2093360 RepID=A0A3A4NIK9_ABYX5|nr:MAG: efflux RND transporter permease subunit [Candidatus Abyssubacteria bacterium SURF_5]
MNIQENRSGNPEVKGWINQTIRFCLENKLIVFLLLAFLLGWGIYVMPFDRDSDFFPSDPIPVDAIPDIGENQQIVFTEWPGRSPQDVEDQVTYPLTISLQGIPGVKSIRSYSMFGFSTVYVIFKDGIDFYWSRSRLLERLNVAQQDLPEGVIPSLGPDATALGQIFWYTVEAKGFDLQELRSIQDWYIRYALQSTEGVSEVASIGGYVKEYQIDVNPDSMRAHGVMLQDVFSAVRKANIDVGAETIEFNGVEYLIRGKGFIKNLTDIENILLKTNDGVPIYVKNVGTAVLGPALRRGVLDKEGAEVVGGVVIVRYGENPLEVIGRLKEKISEIHVGLPKKTLADGSVSQVQIVPFYDRTDLIHQTLETLNDALIEEVLITCFVVFILLAHFRSNILISANLPIAVLTAFILMSIFKVDSNLMSLGGIAIAIGTMVDMGIILCENIVRHFDEASPDEDPLEVIYLAASEVGSAVVTAIATTLISFLPIFALTGPEGRLFKPLAYTKTFALFGSVFVALTVLPAFAHILFTKRRVHVNVKMIAYGALVLIGIVALFWLSFWAGLPLILAGLYLMFEKRLPARILKRMPQIMSILAALFVLALLTTHWMPLGLGTGLTRNLIFVFGINIAWTSLRVIVINFYPNLLGTFLRNKLAFLSLPAALVIFGIVVWQGFGKTFNWIPAGLEKIGLPQEKIKATALWSGAVHTFPGLGREFMPALDEGSFLFMPTTMPHASIGEALDILQKQDRAIRAIPEVDMVVGKIGRAETAIDPAPVSMIETVITYKPEYGPPDPETGKRPRLWRDHIESTDDIWNEIVRAADVPGSTSAPKLQPIAARIVMLQSGMRAPMGVKVRGQTLEEVERVGYDIARFLKEVPSVTPEAVIPDRVVGKPYLEIDLDREKLARYKVNIRDAQDVIEIAVGGIRATTTVEGRERYPVRVRYQRELRDSYEALENILVSSSENVQIPLAQLADISYVPGPQEIKSEDTFLVSYVLFDKRPGHAEVDVVEEAQRYLQAKIESGELLLPPGTNYTFAGNYENQINFQNRFMILLPASLFLIFLILYFQFRSTSITSLIFIQIAVVWAGGFIMLWLAGQPWFLNFSVFGENVRDIFHLRQYNLSVAVWVGFIALFGVATDDAVVITTYLNQQFGSRTVASIEDIRRLTIEAGKKRVRPCLMTTATTVLALLPVLTSSGKGADVMIPMALPLVGGMTIELITLFVMPVVYCWLKEFLWKRGWRKGHFVEAAKAA